MGPVLGLGPQGDGRVHRLGRLRRLPARPLDRGLARQEGRLDQRRRLRRDGVQPVLHQPGRRPGCTRTPGWAEVDSAVGVRAADRVSGRSSGSAIPSQAIPPEWTAPTPPHGMPRRRRCRRRSRHRRPSPTRRRRTSTCRPSRCSASPSARRRAGWRRWLYLGSFTLVNLGEGPKAIHRKELAAQVNRPLRGCYRIALLSLKGGVGKTTITATLGATFASIRGDRVIAVDANPDRGTLSQKVPLETPSTVRHLLRDAEGINSYSDVRSYTSQGPSRLEVLASESDPAVSEAFSTDDYTAHARGARALLQPGAHRLRHRACCTRRCRRC